MVMERPFKEGADFEHLRSVITRETREGPVPMIELFADPEIMSEVTGIDFPADRTMELITPGSDLSEEQLELGVRLLDLSLAFSRTVGYDHVTVIPVLPLPRTRKHLKENPRQQGMVRLWENEHEGLITSRQEFEAFPWPSPDQVLVIPIDYLAGKMPEGMKAISFWYGIFEDLKRLMGIENMAIKSIEEPDLLDDILERLTELAVAAVDKAAAHPATGAIFYGQDMGFNQSTLLSPDFLREHVLSRDRRIAEACHKHGKLFLYHSCGQVDALMEDLIQDVGIDAKHSFQDNIEPVEKTYEKYGRRIAILGGVDVDLLSRGAPEEVRIRTREILDACAPAGGFCIGSGNSVTNFCRIENYYAMVDEVREWNEEHGRL